MSVMKTSELTGAALGWAVSIADGWTPEKCSDARGEYLWLFKNGEGRNPKHYRPSVNWLEGGKIIEREKLGVWWATHVVDEDGNEYGNHWYCETGCTDDNPNDSYHIATGETPLIAAMRCFVASKLGDEVQLPEELTNAQL